MPCTIVKQSTDCRYNVIVIHKIIHLNLQQTHKLYNRRYSNNLASIVQWYSDHRLRQAENSWLQL